MAKNTQSKNSRATDLNGLRKIVSRQAQDILNIIWDYYWKNHQWIPALILYSKFEKHTVLSALKPLGGMVAYIRFENGQNVCQMSLVGVLLAKQGIEAEELMVKYIEFLRTRFLTSPENKKMTSQEIESALGLTAAQSLFLNRLIGMSPFSGGGGFILKEGDLWWADLPQDVVNFPRTGDLRVFFKNRVLENYNPTVPIEENARTIFLSKRSARKDKWPLFEEDAGKEKIAGTKFTSSNVEDAWKKINDDYGVNKKAFGRKINFVTDSFTREVLFRDIGQAYLLANAGFSKSAVILAGSVIEEMLRLFLEYRKIKPGANKFHSYIEACESKGLLKSAIHPLTNSVRHFRNLVHLEKEVSEKHTISKATAIGAVTSIFTIANDFAGENVSGVISA